MTRNITLSSLAMGAALLLMPGTMASAYADDGESFRPPSSWYASVFGGGNFVTSEPSFSNGITQVDVDYDSGFVVGGAIGYRWVGALGSGLTPRTEVEFSYQENDVSSINFSGNGPGQEVVNGGSDTTAFNVLFNLYFDVDNALGDGITPYFGGGIGFSVVDHSIFYNAPNLNFDDQETDFRWHVTAGLSVAVSDNVSLFGDIGYHQIVDTGSLRRIGAAPVGGGAGPGGGIFEDDIGSVLIKVGARVGF